jgi:hypothetical protein
VELVDNAPQLTEQQAAAVEWLPFGVFAVTPDGANSPDVLVQLAVTKDGVLAGTAFDQHNNTSFPIEGTVDKKTQRAVWSYTNDRKERVLMETSVYNLTQASSTGLVHRGPNDFQTVQLVRLEQPSTEAAKTGELPVPPAAPAAPPVPPQIAPPAKQ